MSSLAKEMVDSYGALIEVRDGDWIGASGPVALTLGFERGVVLVSADANDDTIKMSAVESANGRDVSAEAPWSDAIGRGLIWVWALTNQQGYEDGCQFEFGDVGRNDRPEQLCVQVMVAAATLHISTVSVWL
jgi:hypothetical protein